MAAGDAYLFGTAGVLDIGATSLTCVLGWSVDMTKERAEEVQVGCASDPQYIAATPPRGEVEITFALIDGLGTAVALKTLLVGDAGTTNVSVVIMPEGDAAGKPAQTWPNMSLTSKSYTGDGTWDSTDPVGGELTFTGYFDEEPAWAAIGA